MLSGYSLLCTYELLSAVLREVYGMPEIDHGQQQSRQTPHWCMLYYLFILVAFIFKKKNVP